MPALADPKRSAARHRPVGRGQVDGAQDARGSRLGGGRQSAASLLDHLLATPLGQGQRERRRPLAIGLDSRTRGFDAERIVEQIKTLGERARLSGRDALSRLRRRRAAAPLFRDPPPPPARARPPGDRRHRRRARADGAAAALGRPCHRHHRHRSQRAAAADPQPLRQRRRRADADASCRSASPAALPRNADLVFDMRFLATRTGTTELRAADRARRGGRRLYRRRRGL